MARSTAFFSRGHFGFFGLELFTQSVFAKLHLCDALHKLLGLSVPSGLVFLHGRFLAFAVLCQHIHFGGQSLLGFEPLMELLFQLLDHREMLLLPFFMFRGEALLISLRKIAKRFLSSLLANFVGVAFPAASFHFDDAACFGQLYFDTRNFFFAAEHRVAQRFLFRTNLGHDVFPNVLGAFLITPGIFAL